MPLCPLPNKTKAEQAGQHDTGIAVAVDQKRALQQQRKGMSMLQSRTGVEWKKKDASSALTSALISRYNDVVQTFILVESMRTI
jgi:hypothetical protein